MSALTAVSADYQMTEQLQASTLAIIAVVALVMVLGVLSIAKDVRATWSIDDALADMDELADDYWLDRDNHAEDVRDAMRAARSGS